MALASRQFWSKKNTRPNFNKNNSSGAKGKQPVRTCYNCGHVSHFVAECPYEKREDNGGKLIRKTKPSPSPTRTTSPRSSSLDRLMVYSSLRRTAVGVRGCWYVSNVSIIFDCSMLLYLLFWTIFGFIIQFYIIFGTNLLTGGPTQIVVSFCLFQCFEEKEYQTESKRNETFGNVIFGTNMIQRTFTLRQEINQEATR